VMGRATQGVRLINLRDGDKIAAVSQVPKSENGDEEKAENLADEAKKDPEMPEND
jgi:DNA gyrase subunit A